MNTNDSTRRLLEQAALDALGLLDDEERVAFDTAFLSASDSLQAHLRREQKRIAALGVCLPDVAMPDGLREAVLAAVREAIRSEREPASIEAAIAGVIGHGAGHEVPDLPRRPLRRVSRLWRATALGLLVASVILSYATLQMKSQFDQVAEAQDSIQMAEAMLRLFGPDYREAMMDQRVIRASFASANQRFRARAALWFDPDSDKAWFVFEGLPVAQGQPYRLVVLDSNDRIVNELASFQSNGQFDGQPIKLDVPLNTRLAILAPGAAGQGEPLMQTRTLDTYTLS